eukprot:6211310-Pleurochrysis_carterae.AAC.2
MHQMYQFSAAQHVLNLFVPRWSKGIRARGHTETLESVPLQRTLPPTEFDVCQARVAKALGTLYLRLITTKRSWIANSTTGNSIMRIVDLDEHRLFNHAPQQHAEGSRGIPSRCTLCSSRQGR